MPTPLATATARLLDLAFPPVCPACGRSTAECGGVDFCAECEGDLPLFEGPVCPRCATPHVASSSSVLPTNDCPVCRDERWAFDGAAALGAYEGLLRRLVLDAKRPSGEASAAALGRLLAQRHGRWLAPWLEPSSPPATQVLVTPIPQHWRRRLVRRADGVAAFAASLAREAGLPIKRTLSRSRSTPRQTEVAPSERRRNVRGAFVVANPRLVAEKTVLLIDDVLTTGSTCHAAAQALKRAGAAQVVAVVAARRIGPL